MEIEHLNRVVVAWSYVKAKVRQSAIPLEKYPHSLCMLPLEQERVSISPPLSLSLSADSSST